MKTYTLKVSSFRKTPSPLDEKSQLASYVALCDVKNLPLDIPTEHTNPRDQKLTHGVAKAIAKSFLEDENFWLLNRGILFSVDSVKFDNSKNLLTLNLTDDDKHGNVDGGHTYKVIKENIGKLGKGNTPETQFVRLEIVTGADDFFGDLADARNTSNQVDTKSLAELNDLFDVIKEQIKNEPFFGDIAFKQYEAGKRIDARAVVALVGMFNPEMFPLPAPPVQTYSGKEKCTEKYVDFIKGGNQSFSKMSIIPDIFKLYSYIEKKMPEKYKESKEGARYGSIKGIFSRPSNTLFTKENIDYETSEGFIYPIVASFRALIEHDKSGNIVWKFNPFECFDEIGEELVVSTIERSRAAGHNPQSVGKDSGHWASLFDKVQNYALKKEVEQLRKNAATNV